MNDFPLILNSTNSIFTYNIYFHGMMRQKPEYLCPGDLIAIVAPAGKVRPEEVLPAVGWLENRGYRIWQGAHWLGSFFQFSGTLEERLDDLQQALDNPEVKAILFARGGYGLIHLAAKISLDGFIRNPKWLAGYSDITILHSICANLDIASLHGPMLRGAIDPDGIPSGSFVSMVSMLEGQKENYHAENSAFNRAGVAEAPLVGGNLSLLYSLLGTPFDLNTEGKILFIEDIGEYLYHVDRMMYSLNLAGKLHKLKGLVIGQFTDVKDNQEPFGKNLEQVIFDAVAGYDYPVCFGFQAGHEKINHPMVFGHNWRLNVGIESVIFMETDDKFHNPL
jgi:muramoyltetrapeptide carboxypeptidase